MAAVCINASLETLRSLCCRRTLRLQRDLCRCLHKGSPQALQAVVMPSACHFLQNSPQFIVQGCEVCTPQGPILGTDEGQKVPLQPLLSCLGLWAGTESCWKTYSWPLKKVMLRCFTTPCSTSSWYTQTPVSPLSLDNINPLNAELNPICHLLALLGGTTIVVVSRLRVKAVTELMARPSIWCV